MIGERENVYPDTDYGTLIMRPYDIDGNEINAFYDAQDNLIFVLDNTINAQKPNVLLVINPDGDKKWDEILSSDYDVDLETIRPKVDNKYQKLDIEYSGLPVYEGLINAHDAGDDLEEHLKQLSILRDSAARHSAMMRLSVANETISKTNATIVKTKESIVRLEVRIKTLRSKLSAEKKLIGKISTKQSASKILKLESQIEAANEKLKRAKRRLFSAQKRLEAATVDAELASDLLNQKPVDIKPVMKRKTVMVTPKYPVQTVEDEEEYEEEEPESGSVDEAEYSITTENKEEEPEEENEYIEEVSETEQPQEEVQPLFKEDPQILDEDIAFKPISFDAPVFSEEAVNDAPIPVLTPITEAENKPVIDTIKPVEPEYTPDFASEPMIEEKTEIVEEEKQPLIETIKPVPAEDIITPAPVAPVVKETPVVITEVKEERSKPGFIYYILLFILILLSVFTLWLYQKNMKTDTAPVLIADPQESIVEEPVKKVEPVVMKTVEEKPESVFLDETEVSVPTEDIAVDDNVMPETEEQEYVQRTEPLYISPDEDVPVVLDAVPGYLNTSGTDYVSEEAVSSEEEILAKKPVYEPGAKYDDMFISNEDYEESENNYVENNDVVYYDENDPFFDAEEAAYQAEEMYY